MPVCPGCEQQIAYDRLDLHERYCDRIWSANEVESRVAEQLERRLLAVEDRIDGRLRDLESDVERRLVRLEKSGAERRSIRR